MPASSKTNRSRGFTLIELLVAASILALVITAVGAVLAGAIQTWRTVRDHLRLEAGALPGLAIWERDIMNAEPFYLSAEHGGLQGSADTIVIPLTVFEPEADGGVPGFVRYRFDSQKRAVMRDQWLLDQDAPPAERAAVWIQHVDVLSMDYIAIEDFSENMQFPASVSGRETWDNPMRLPAAISISLKLSAPPLQSMELRRTLLLPRGRR